MPVGIKYFDGTRLQRCVVAAAQRVLDVQERLNNINVFPVADGDTGTNMALTLKSMADDAINAGELDLTAMSRQLADSALMSARGNSGTILAQFFQGLAKGFQNKQRVGLEGFVAAAELAVRNAEQAINRPTEGTILTVMRAWNAYLREAWPGAPDFVTLLKGSISAADRALKETPKQLKVLARAGVVDAGAQGFVNMLEGVVHLIETGKMDWTVEEETRSPERRTLFTEEAGDIAYRYCTECLIEGEALDASAIRAAAEDLGDSLIVAGSETKIKIHVHTNEPDTLFERARGFGLVARRKAEDMHALHRSERQGARDIALIADSSCNLPMEYIIHNRIRLIPVCVTFENRTYLDRLDITAEEVYRQMAQGKHPKTSLPTPGSYHQAYAKAGELHKKAVAIFMSGALSGTYEAGVAAAKSYPEIDIRVVDSRSIAPAMGMLLQIAVEAIEEGCDLDEVHRRVLAARPYCRLFISFTTLEHLIRGGRVGRVQGFIARMLNLVPILTITPEGKLAPLAKGRPGKPCWQKLMKIVLKEAKGLHDLRFSICHAGNREAAEYFETELKRELGLESVEIMQVSPTVGAQVGLGTAAICMYGLPQGVAL